MGVAVSNLTRYQGHASVPDFLTGSRRSVDRYRSRQLDHVDFEGQRMEEAISTFYRTVRINTAETDLTAGLCEAMMERHPWAARVFAEQLIDANRIGMGLLQDFARRLR